MGEGKGADALAPFFHRIKNIKNKVKALASDMSMAYIAAVLKNLPKADIVSCNQDVLCLGYCPITTILVFIGPLEGTNNKIKTLQKQAYRFRGLDFFKHKIYVLHESKYALIG